MQAAHPTGAQHELHRGDQHAVVVEVGGGLRSYQLAGRAYLDGYAEQEQVTGARGQTLAPWPNRLADGRYAWDGESRQLALDEPDRHNAIHGLVRWVNWTAQRAGDDELTMTYRLHAQPGWPHVLDLAVHYRLAERGLVVTTTATNLGERPCPYGTGAHPYLTVGTARIDDATLQVPAELYLATDDRGLPTGEHPVDGTALDFRRPRPLGEAELDNAFTDLHRDADGLARVRLTAADGTAVALWQDRAYPYVEVFTGDTLPPALRRRGLGVEPMTMPPNALASGQDVIRLAPGETHTARWGIDPLPG